MAVSLELMDVDSGNLVGSYATLEEALEIIRNVYSRHGESGVQGLVLLLLREDGSQHEIFSDLDLIRLAADRQVTARPS